MAQERYGFFDSSGEDIRSYSSVDIATAFHALASTGVTNTGTNLAVTAEVSTMRVLVGYGTAMIEGFYYQLRNDGGAVKAFTHTTEAELNRIDRIVLRLDLTARTISLVKLIGTAAATPEAPALTRNDETYEISLAQVLIRAAAEELLGSDITDERVNDEVCGLIAPESLRRTTIEQMINAAVEQLSGNYTDVLRYSAQALEAEQKTQARANIGAQVAITASGMLKGNGAGGVSAAEAGTDFASPVIEISATLAAASWTGASAPFSQTITVAGMTAARKGVCAGLPATATDAQFEAAAEAMLRISAQGTDTLTIKAHGDQPAIDIPVLVMIKG